MINECENLGIILDVLYLLDGGFYDLIKVCKKFFIVLYFNVRVIMNYFRNLSDEMIKLLVNKGGVMGINFCLKFLGKVFILFIEEIIEYIKYIKYVGGIDILFLGSDFDGIINDVEIKNVLEFNKLYEVFKKSNFIEDDIEKIFYKNV